jgi:phage protein|nr:MAG TPA: hypothetical protein [Caudoviricetes sp.]
MKIGFRTPNLKKRISARTTGALKRKIKKAINPFYGKKGIGMISNPKKALYNKVYNKVTFDPLMLNKLIKSLNIYQQVSESDGADIIDSDEKILKRYIFSDKFKKLIVKNKKEHTKNFILGNTLKKLSDGEIKTEEEIINYIIFLDNRMSFNKNLFKFILITYILIMIFILLGKK